MPDNKKKVRESNLGKVAGETYEVQYAAKKFGTTPTDAECNQESRKFEDGAHETLSR
jgi:hypothetical protein